MLVATLAALSAAALFAVATALQHRSAGLVAGSGTGLVSFMVKTLRDPLWIIGNVAGDGGLVLHALALRDGPLTVVQPLLVTSVVFALALRKLLEHRRPRRNEFGWACALAVGLVLFILISTPAGGVAQPADPIPTVLLGTIIGLGILGFFVAGRRATGSSAAIMLGTATGLSYAASASLLKAVMGTLDHGAVRVGLFLGPLCPYRRRELERPSHPACLPGWPPQFQPPGNNDGRPDRQPCYRRGHI